MDSVEATDYDKLKLAEIGERIHAYLQGFVAEEDTVKKTITGLDGEQREIIVFWRPRCYAAGSKVKICYVGYQGDQSLTKADALIYLKWLDAGHVGKHVEVIPAPVPS